MNSRDSNERRIYGSILEDFGLPPTATYEQIRRGGRSVLQRIHPDKVIRTDGESDEMLEFRRKQFSDAFAKESAKLKVALKYASAYAPRSCLACSGQGMIVKLRGFKVFSSKCRLCHGTGAAKES